MLKINNLSKITLGFGITAALLYVAYFQFIYPAFCDPDSYYHIAVSNFIKNYGLHYSFDWLKFSTFKGSFADKDILFHILNLPFLLFTDNPVLAGKYALIFQDGLFFLTYILILKKYLPGYLAAIFLLLPMSCWNFTVYLMQLRSVTAANACMVLGIYFLINKRLLKLFIIALIYPLAHVSFSMLLGLAFVCEILRLFFKKEFFLKNIYVTLAGIVCGCLIHPDFPRNLFAFYLNGIVVPLCGLIGRDPGFAGEMQAFNTLATLSGNSTALFSLNIIFWALLLAKKRISFPTAVWFASTSIFLFLAFLGNRYWYQVNTLFFIFFASCLNDWKAGLGWPAFLKKIKIPAVLYLIVISVFFVYGSKQLNIFMGFSCGRSSYFEDTGRWMNKHIPAGQTIYHSYWTDAPYFICLNPKNTYLNALDPIYMLYRYPREFRLLDELSLGMVNMPYEAINKIFGADYGYINKFEPLYRQMLGYPRNCQVIYENDEGAVFKILSR